MIRVVSAVDETTRADFETSLSKMAQLGTDVQLDFNDGSFASYKTVTPQEVYDLIVRFDNKVNLEAHLMVQKPFDYIPKLIESGVKKFFLQYEIDDNLRDLLEQLNEENCLVGLAIGPKTQIDELEPFLDLLDSVNVMTVNPGKQGQVFLPENLTKISDLRNTGYGGEIEVDGGIDDKTVLQAKQFELDTLVVGHYLAKADNPQENLEHLNLLLER